MNEIVPYPVDVRVDHQRVNEPKDQHHPERRARTKSRARKNKRDKTAPPPPAAHPSAYARIALNLYPDVLFGSRQHSSGKTSKQNIRYRNCPWQVLRIANVLSRR